MQDNKTMEEKVLALKEKLTQFASRDLLGMISIRFTNFYSKRQEDFAVSSDIFNKTNLLSPQRQFEYLAGLLMSTEDKHDGSMQDDFQTQQIIEKEIQDITAEYMENFVVSTDFSDETSREKSIVCMEAFSSYFDTGILRYPEQTIRLINYVYRDFNNEFECTTGLTIDDCLSFYYLVRESFSEAFETLFSASEPIKKLMEEKPNTIEEETRSKLGQSFYDAIQGLNTIKKAKIVGLFGDNKAEKLINAFSLVRKDRDFIFYNQQNPFTEKPLCWLSDNETLFVVHPNFLINAIYSYITVKLEDPLNEYADRYKKHKATTTEALFLKLFKTVLGNSAHYYTNVCESRGTLEHDIVIETTGYILVAEIKGSKVREPFFNPDKAYQRIKDHFHSAVGIGGGYKQAIRLKQYLESTDKVVLFNNGTEKVEIEKANEKKIIPVVLTLNQFGSLAVNTSLLLDKDDANPYPWVCNWHDFENLIEVMNYLGKTSEDFLEYISWRMDVHPNILSSDELDVLDGYFTDSQIKQKAKEGMVFFPPNAPSIIDKIYFERHGVKYTHPGIRSHIHKHKKTGRNDPCPCGSGKKFKRCCIGKGIYD